MATYQMPPDTSAREKIIGGILDVSQLGWAAIGIGISLALGSLGNLMLGVPGLVIFAIPGVAFGLIFCFYKPHEMTVFQYLTRKRKHKLKTKNMINFRKEGLNEQKVNEYLDKNLY